MTLKINQVLSVVLYEREEYFYGNGENMPFSKNKK